MSFAEITLPPAAPAPTPPRAGPGGPARALPAWLRLAVVPALVVVLGVLLSIFAYQQQHGATMARWEESLRDRALDRVRAMQEKINDVESVLRASVGFFEASRRIDKREFAAFASQGLAANRAIRVLAWAPRVADSFRERFEALAQLQADPGFVIRDAAGPTGFRAAARRAEHFPLLYSASRRAGLEILGLDLASTAPRREAIDQASLTRRLVAIPPIPQVLDGSGFILLAPAFRASTDQVGTAALQEFEGVLTAAVGLPELVETAFAGMEPAGFDLHVFGTGPRPTRTAMDYYPAAGGEHAAARQTYAEATAGLHWTSWLRTGDKTLLVVMSASPALAETAPHGSDLDILLLGGLASILAAAFLFTSQLRARRLERVSRELRTTMDSLSSEMREREAAQEHLRASEARHRMLVERMNEGVGIIDDKAVVTYANERLTAMLGLAPDEFVGHHIDEFLAAQDHDLLRSQLAERAHGRRAPYELRWRRKDGRELVTLVSPEPLWGPDSTYRGSFATFTDITDRVAAEREVHRRDAVLQAIAAAATELMRTPELDVALPRAIETLGRAMNLGRVIVFEARTDTAGRAISDLRHEWVAPGVTSVMPSGDNHGLDLAAAGLERWAEHFRENRIVVGTVASLPEAERRLVAAGGARSILIVPIHADGQWCGQVGFDDCAGERDWLPAEIEALRTLAELIGVSIARARTHRALADANTIVEGSPAVLFRWGNQNGWNVLYVSANVSQLGWTPEDFTVAGLTYDKLVLAEDRVRVGREVDEHLAKGVERFSQEYRIRTKDGRVLWVEDHTSVVYEDGRVAYLQGTVEDVTARRHAEEALRETTHVLNERVKELTFLHRFASLRSSALPFDEIVQQSTALLPAAFLHPEVLAVRITVNGQCFATPQLRETSCRIGAEGRANGHARVQVEAFYPEPRHPADRASFVPEEAAMLQQVATELATTLVQRETEDQLRTAELIVEKSPIVLYRMTPQDNWPITYVSRNTSQFGYTPEQILALPEGAASLLHPDDRQQQREALQRSVQEGREHMVRQYRLRDGDGQYRWVEDHTRVIRGSGGQAPAVEGMIVDISDRRRAEEQIAHLARHDALTDLPNRATFMERLGLALAQARRGGPPFAVLCIDLDHFKDVNDTRGHAIGDMLLREVATRLAHTARDTDTVARLGGDEFAILQAHTRDPADAAALAQRVIDVLTTPIVIDGIHLVSNGSVGIAVSSVSSGTAETLMMQADLALYRAKDEGRGTYRFHTQDMDTSVRRRVLIADELRHAIAQNQLYLDYQPQVDLADGAMTGVEALVRWRHPERGFISPGEFIPVAETSGLILPIGAWVLNEALRQARLWLDAGLSPGVIAVNLSGVQFKAGTFATEISAALAAHNIPADQLELELTESVFMEVTQERSETLKSLRQMGVHFAIDDFGTGYSSLEYLRSFHVDRLKIARSFIDGVTPGSSEAAIVEATIGLSKALGVAVLAEGVETRAELAFLQSRGCEQAQGYLFSRPVSPDKIAELLQRRSLLPEPAAEAPPAEAPVRAAG